jgi:hypothetical protein
MGVQNFCRFTLTITTQSFFLGIFEGHVEPNGADCCH